MKIIKTNNDELYIARSGIPMLLGGIVACVIALGALIGTLHVGGQGGLIARLVAAVVGVVGVIVGITASNRELFLRRTGTGEVRSTSILLHKVRSMSFAADQVVAVGFETHDQYSGVTANNNGVQTRQRESSVWLILQDTTEVPLLSATKSANNSLSIGGVNLAAAAKAPLYTEATTIADFYGVPLQSRAATQSLGTNLGVFADSARRMMNAPAPSAPLDQSAMPPQSVEPVAPPVVTAPAPAAPVTPAAPVPMTPVSAAQPLPAAPMAPDRSAVQVPPRPPQL